LQKFPEWTEGEVMLATIELRRGRIEPGRDALDRLYPVIAEKWRSRPVIVWEIGQELAQHKASLDVAAKYLTVAIQRGHEIDWTKADSPAGHLIDAYVAHERKADARSLLRQSVPKNLRFHPTSVLNPAASEIAQVVSIAGRLQSLDDPIAAMEICFAAQKRLGNDRHPALQSMLQRILVESDPAAMARYLECFEPNSPSLHLYLNLPESDADTQQLHGAWDKLIRQIASDRVLVERTRKGLERVLELQTDKLTPQVLAIQLSCFAGNREQAEGSTGKLMRYLDERPTEGVSNQDGEDRPKQRLSSDSSLWLVARECLNEPHLVDIGTKLARRALNCSLAEKSPEFAMLILSEWIQIVVKNGDMESAGRLQSELDQLRRP
jgi:hypothetical protein